MQLTWYGHSTVLVELDGIRLLTDPVLRARVLHLRRNATVDARAIGRVDAILVSHGHWDHLDLRSLRHLARAATVIVPRGLGPLLRRRGCTSVTEVSPGSDTEFGSLHVRAVHAEHGRVRRGLGGASPAIGYVLVGSRRIYFAGDTDLFAGMSDLAPLDVALLPVSGWGRRLPAGHLSPQRAAEALALLRPAVAVPIHWGTYSAWRARPPDMGPAERFARAASEVAPDVVVRIPAPAVAIDL